MALAIPSASTVANSSFRKWMILAVASLAALLQVIDTSIVNVALTDMQSTLGATLSEVGWVITSYAMATVIMIPLAAWLAERFGQKRYFVFSIAGFTAASVLCGMAPSLPFLIFARILQGIAGGGLLAKAQAILFENFPPEEQSRAQGIFGVGVIAGPAIGPTLGGWLTTNYSWPWIFYVNLPVGIIAVFMALSYLPEDKNPPIKGRSVDWAGIIFLIIGFGGLQWMLEDGNSEDWFESPLINTLAIAAVLGIGLFIWRELTAKNPAVDLRVLRHRSLAAGSVFSAVLGMGLFGAIFVIPIYAQSMMGYTAQQTGFLMLPGALASAVMMPLMGKIANKMDARILIATGALVVVAALFMLSNLTPQTGEAEMFWPLILRGAGTVAMFLPLTLATLSPVPKPDIPAASGFYNLTRQLGGSIGIAVLTTVLSRREFFHHANLVEKINAYDPATIERLNLLTAAFQARAGSDLVKAQHQALYTIELTIRAQAAVMSFNDCFRIVSVIFLASLPLLLFLSKGSNGKDAPAPMAEH